MSGEVSMPKCRENWRRRKSRHAKRRMIARRRILAKVRLRSGARPYYEAYALRVRKCGKKGFTLTYKERLSAEGRKLYRDLMAMCEGVTVKLPPSVLAEVYGKKSEREQEKKEVSNAN